MRPVHRRKKTRPPVGSRPGTLMIPEGWPKPELCVMRYTPEHVHETTLKGLAELDAAAKEGVTWLDVRGLGD
jgi:hypothetical protein